MVDFTLDAFKGLNKEALEQLVSNYLLEKCGCHAEISNMVEDPNASIHSWDVGQITLNVKRVGRVGSFFKAS